MFGTFKYLVAFTALAGLALVQAEAIDLNLDAEAIAETASSTISVNCTEPTITAFTPAIAYTLTISNPTATSVPSGASHSMTAALSNNLGDANPAVTTVNHSTTTKLHFWHLAPKSKLGGLQCSTYGASTIDVLGDAADDANFEISFGALTATTYAAANKVDNVNTGSYVMAFGTGGIVSTLGVYHSQDSESTTMDGEVTIGPGPTTTRGGYRIANEMKYLTVNPGTITETLRLRFTPGSM